MSSEIPMISSEIPMISSEIPMLSSTPPPSKTEECKQTSAYYWAVLFLVLGLIISTLSGIMIFVMRKEKEDIDNTIWIAFFVGLIITGVCSYVIHIEEKKRKEKCKN